MAKKNWQSQDEDAPDTEAGDVAEATTAVADEPAGKRFLVEYGDLSQVIEADNDRHAWALFCDKNRVYPSPKAGKVTAV